jgi:carboxypeptidase PM20D1
VRRLAVASVLLLLVLGLVLSLRALTLESRQQAEVAPVSVAVDAQAAARRFAGAIGFPTISRGDTMPHDTAAFEGLHEYLAATYPLVHTALEVERVNGLSLLYRWEGADSSARPVILMGHLDVVPVIPGTEAEWTHPPFAGIVADGYVWGRGTLDDKVSVVAILEAVEALLSDGFRPPRTVYLAFGHDEEIGGGQGAGAIAELLHSRGVDEIAMVLDEGGAIVEGGQLGLDGLVALVGIAEKGYVSLELVVEGEGGHSSVPPSSTNIGILSRAITRLEENPFPADLSGATGAMFETIAPELPFGARIAFANRWLFDPLLRALIAGSPQGSAMVRTTTAATMFTAGVKDNVLPIRATAVVNFRILPGETPETVAGRVRAAIDDDRVQVRGEERGWPPSPISDPSSPAFAMLERTIREVVPRTDLVVTPYLVTGGTDAKYYSGRSPNVYRFLPAVFEPDALSRFHGTDERLSVESFGSTVAFFRRLIHNLGELP